VIFFGVALKAYCSPPEGIGVRRAGHDWTRRRHEAARRGKLRLRSEELVAPRIESAGTARLAPLLVDLFRIISAAAADATRHSMSGKIADRRLLPTSEQSARFFWIDGNRERRMGTREFVQRTESRRSHTWHRFPQQTNLFPVTRILGQNEISMI
jgi:hypothetical protein